MGPKKIVISGGVLRANPDGTPNQPLNIRWLYHLLAYPLSLAVKDADIGLVVWEAGGSSIDARQVYDLNGLEANESNWARLASAKEFSESSRQYLRGFYEGSLVLGFELPDLLLHFFNRCGIDYVDFAVHPVRYLDDFFFGIRTNIPDAFAVLTEHAVSEEVFYLQASIHKATVSRMRPPDIRENSCLCVGQTRVDKSLLAGERVLSLLDFLDDLARIALPYNAMYFKPHPYASADGDVERKLLALGKVETIHENIYRLLCHDAIKEVVGISSSVIYEARFFGKKGTYLLGNPMKLYDPAFPEGFDPWTFVPIYDDFFNPRFWSEMLKSKCRVRACADIKLPAKTSRLRISAQSHWGYNFLDYEILLRNMIGERV